MKCERCEKKIPNNTGNKKYCEECSKIVDREKARERMAKRRKNKNVRS